MPKILIQSPLTYEDKILIDIIELVKFLDHTDSCMYHILEDTRDKLKNIAVDYHFDEVEDD